MDMVPVPMQRPLRLAAALLIASVVVGCEPAQDEFDLSTVATIPTAESIALVALYDSTDGDNWNNNTGWLLSADPCSWREVTCSSGHVIRLDLVLNDLTGSIPPELGNLTALQYLGRGWNQLTGTIPAELGDLTDLSYLSLNANNLTGSIPAELGDLAVLGTLSLEGNNLTGSIPVELGNLTALTDLFLFSNGLSGPVPLPVASLGAQLPECRLESNSGLFIPDSQDYMDADLDNDGFICGIALSTPTP